VINETSHKGWQMILIAVYYLQASFNLQDAVYTAALTLMDEAITLRKARRKLACFHISGRLSRQRILMLQNCKIFKGHSGYSFRRSRGKSHKQADRR
jgi:hypothetical protein